METRHSARPEPSRCDPAEVALPGDPPSAIWKQRTLLPHSRSSWMEGKTSTLEPGRNGFGSWFHFWSWVRIFLSGPTLLCGAGTSPARLLGGVRMHPQDRNRTRHATCPRRKLFTPLRSEVQSLQAKDLQGTS